MILGNPPAISTIPRISLTSSTLATPTNPVLLHVLACVHVLVLVRVLVLVLIFVLIPARPLHPSL
jgi:hypothetical protein